MKGFAAVGTVLAMAARALAQGQDDPVESRVQRLREQLSLTEEQTGKVREIYKKQYEDLHGVLTDDQRRRYDEMNRAFSRGSSTFGSSRSSWYPSTDELKTQLSLAEDQVSKINAIRDGVREEIRNYFRNRGSRPAGEDIQKAMDRLREESVKKIRDVLADEQKTKFDEIQKNYSGQQEQGGVRIERRGPSVDERVARVMENLKVEDAKEAEAIKGVIKKVIEHMDRLDAFQRDARAKIDDAIRNKELSDDAVGDRIAEIHKGQKEIEKDLAAARKELADIVTNRQELELIRRGILR